MSMRQRVASSLFLVSVLSACGPNRVEGTAAGQSLTVRDAVFLVPQSNLGEAGAFVILSDEENLCDRLVVEPAWRKSRFLTMYLTEMVGGRILAPEAREYWVGSTSPKVEAAFVVTDGNGSRAIDAWRGQATAGKVLVDQLATQRNASGSFELQIGQVDSITGTFSASRCFVSPEDASRSAFGPLLGSIGDPCQRQSRCSADPLPTAADIQACQEGRRNTGAKCYRENVALSDCFVASQVCTSAQVTDGSATLMACQAELAAANACASR
ncbi:MAG: hypothetical protein AB1938_13050 [Myxococcota bacterium]